MIERPKSLNEFLGQERVKKILKIAIESAKQRKEPLDHILFYGPPGTGKTTLSMIIARELEKEIKIVSAPTIEKKGDLLALVTSLNEGDVLFIDEIHRLNRAVEETIYSAMEDFRIDIVTGETRAKSFSIDLPKFTLIGATTRLNLLTPPFRSRFGIVCRLELYSAIELKEIAKTTSAKLGIRLSERALEILARCSRGAPRILNQLLKRFRDYATVNNWKEIDSEKANKILMELGIDSYGLDPMDRKILKTIAETFKGGPVGLTTLATVLKEDVDTIENVHEPYLIELGLIVKTPRGRKITSKALKLLGLTHNKKSPLFGDS
ncbi:Holliday junction ATP-dependent DNA helicase ruvB [Desulfurobacterium thermolithotrophum DSM 11699]|uniref:Holliday junction branch migration complex subunit RuvB n=1 Tax=Desulfurobacterium thermolithotrophum (strain DSM 11699 / BSA) TaxID=868864 RepID=F0S1G6_DESTD|nr:Holliday junction branch migration DNA helicase RuvB [Desulfurobacterium thermolithotrophum]ADY73969.1 Holliday junction ATP-dependent DNA helicase ruvB [Desulfurobacterium thermolithotrophum DSM 11699]